MAQSLIRQEEKMNLGSKLFDEFEVVRARYLDAMETTIIELDTLLGAIDRPDVQERALEGIRFRAHKISGTAATFGYPRIGDLARHIETTLDQRSSRFEPSQTKKVGELLEVLLDEMEQTLDGQTGAPCGASS
jgi:HPt (histidine-containing phosphotransfer) domain-containing protein